MICTNARPESTNENSRSTQPKWILKITHINKEMTPGSTMTENGEKN